MVDEASPSDAGILALAELRGLGPASARMLADAGIPNPLALRELGAIAAFARVAEYRDKAPSLNLLFALEGAITDRDWRDVVRHDGAALRLAWEDLAAGPGAWAPPATDAEP